MRVGLFPGQGVPAATVLEALPVKHRLLDVASEALGFDLRQRVKRGTGRGSSVLSTSLAQPAIFSASLIGWLRSPRRSSCDFLLGHSLGEYTALVAAGAMSFADGLRVVQVRGQAMDAAARTEPGGMMALLALDETSVTQVIEASGVTLANDNGPGQIVVSGDEASLSLAGQMARSLKGRAVLLDVSGPFHSPAMTSARSALGNVIEGVSIRIPKLPVLSNVTAEPYRNPGEIRKMLVEGLTHRVRFRECLEHVWNKGVDEFEDFGPGNVVETLASRSFQHRSREAVSARA